MLANSVNILSSAFCGIFRSESRRSAESRRICRSKSELRASIGNDSNCVCVGNKLRLVDLGDSPGFEKCADSVFNFFILHYFSSFVILNKWFLLKCRIRQAHLLALALGGNLINFVCGSNHILNIAYSLIIVIWTNSNFLS